MSRYWNDLWAFRCEVAQDGGMQRQHDGWRMVIGTGKAALVCYTRCYYAYAYTHYITILPYLHKIPTDKLTLRIRFHLYALTGLLLSSGLSRDDPMITYTSLSKLHSLGLDSCNCANIRPIPTKLYLKSSQIGSRFTKIEMSPIVNYSWPNHKFQTEIRSQ